MTDKASQDSSNAPSPPEHWKRGVGYPVGSLVLFAIVAMVVYDFWPYITVRSRASEVYAVAHVGSNWAKAEQKLISRGYETNAFDGNVLIILGRSRLVWWAMETSRELFPEWSTKHWRVFTPPLARLEFNSSGTVVRHRPPVPYP